MFKQGTYFSGFLWDMSTGQVKSEPSFISVLKISMTINSDIALIFPIVSYMGCHGIMVKELCYHSSGPKVLDLNLSCNSCTPEHLTLNRLTLNSSKPSGHWPRVTFDCKFLSIKALAKCINKICPVGHTKGGHDRFKFVNDTDCLITWIKIA